MSAPLLVTNGHTNVMAADKAVNGIMTLSAPDHAYINDKGRRMVYLLAGTTHQLGPQEFRQRFVQRQKSRWQWR